MELVTLPVQKFFSPKSDNLIARNGLSEKSSDTMIHEKEELLHCTFCVFGTNSKQELDTHIKTVHKIENDEIKTQGKINLAKVPSKDCDVETNEQGFGLEKDMKLMNKKPGFTKDNSEYFKWVKGTFSVK